MSQPWVADPAIGWRILLTAALARPLDAASTLSALADLHAEQGWRGVGQVMEADDLSDLQARLTASSEHLVQIGLAGTQVVVSCHHSQVDGLGLLAVLQRVLGTQVSSSARGVGDRPHQAGALGTVGRRLAEVALAPPARIASPGGDSERGTDVLIEAAVPGVHQTAALVHAAVRGIGAPRRTAVAIGVARPVDDGRILDRSALLRLRDVEKSSSHQIAEQLRDAATQRPVRPGSGAGLMQVGLRLLAGRLGSTLLVSHLGKVTAPGVDRLAFHPVTAGGSGVSLGAVALGGETVVTLRARGSAWTRDGLEQLLEAVVTELP